MNRSTFMAVVGALMVHCAFAQTVHIVGDGLGWDVPSNGAAAYSNWASRRTFMVGDILVFNFTTGNHDVLQVPIASFDACTSDNAIGNLILTGPANVTLSSAGEHYYICTIGRHCLAGQKLAISVSGTPGANPPTTTPPATTPSRPATPSPTSNQPDACPPTPSPSSTPTSQTPSAGILPPTPPASSSSTNVFASLVLTLASIATVVFL